MTQDPKAEQPITFENFFDFEEDSDVRHEFHDGAVIEMAGASINHARIRGSITRGLHQALKGKECEVLDADVRLVIPSDVRSMYPDVLVVCGEMEKYDGDKRGESLLNPTVIFEVLSPSTSNRDGHTKLKAYIKIPSVRQYFLVEQDEPRVDYYTRLDDGSWNFRYATGLDAVLDISSLKAQLPFADIYAGVEWEPDEPAAEPKE